MPGPPALDPAGSRRPPRPGPAGSRRRRRRRTATPRGPPPGLAETAAAAVGGPGRVRVRGGSRGATTVRGASTRGAGAGSGRPRPVSASATACAVGGRSAGSRARQAITSRARPGGASGRPRATGAGATLSRAREMAISVSPWNGSRAGQHLVEDEPERVDVGAGVDRAHRAAAPARGSGPCRRRSPVRRSALRAAGLRDPEVGHLDPPPGSRGRWPASCPGGRSPARCAWSSAVATSRAIRPPRRSAAAPDRRGLAGCPGRRRTP